MLREAKNSLALSTPNSQSVPDFEWISKRRCCGVSRSVGVFFRKIEQQLFVDVGNVY